MTRLQNVTRHHHIRTYFSAFLFSRPRFFFVFFFCFYALLAVGCLNLCRHVRWWVGQVARVLEFTTMRREPQQKRQKAKNVEQKDHDINVETCAILLYPTSRKGHRHKLAQPVKFWVRVLHYPASSIYILR